MAITKEANLTIEALMFANRCLEEADQSALREMGFGPREIDELQRLTIADLNRLGAICAHVLRVGLNREAFWHMIERIKQHRASEEMQEMLIKADAPQEMMQALFGVGAKEYTRRRRQMALEPAVGRPAEPDEDKAHALWEAWQALVEGEDVELLAAEDYLALKVDTGVGLRAIWYLTRRWAQYGNPEGMPRM